MLHSGPFSKDQRFNKKNQKFATDCISDGHTLLVAINNKERKVFVKLNKILYINVYIYIYLILL